MLCSLLFALTPVRSFCTIPVRVLSDPSAPTESINTHRKKLEDDILIGGESSNIATNGMLDTQPTERYKAISLQAVDKVAER